MVEEININYELLPKSSLDICFNKLITHLRLQMLIKCDYKPVRETSENTLLYTKHENRALTISHLSLELSTNMTNLTVRNLKSFEEYICQ
jgi:UDP-3-O-acyl-N-acetylglucosamine deacetylase